MSLKWTDRMLNMRVMWTSGVKWTGSWSTLRQGHFPHKRNAWSLVVCTESMRTDVLMIIPSLVCVKIALKCKE